MKLEYTPLALNSTDEQTTIAASIYTEALKHVSYKNWDIVVTMTDAYGHAQLQSHFTEDGLHWTTRKWLLSPHMTKSEIIQTAFKCILAAEEHEAREKFLYKGKSVFGPHFDVDKLHELCEMPDALDARMPFDFAQGDDAVSAGPAQRVESSTGRQGVEP